MELKVISKNGIEIRLTADRWRHIVLMHPNLVNRQKEILNIVKNPNCILRGSNSELLAVSKI